MKKKILFGTAGSVLLVLMAATISRFAVTAEERAEVEACGDLRVRGNVITPYGLTIVDCARAEDVARKFVEDERVSVRASGACWLSGFGAEVRFECNDIGGELAWIHGIIVADGDQPVWDESGRISAIVLIKGWVSLNYQALLLKEGAAVLSDDCKRPDLSENDYCHVIRRWTDVATR